MAALSTGLDSLRLHDESFVRARTIGLNELSASVDGYTPAHAASICDVVVVDIHRAAEILGTYDRLLSTVLQRFYQSNQATAATCQVTTSTSCGR